MSLNVQNNLLMSNNMVAFKSGGNRQIRKIIPDKADREIIKTMIMAPIAVRIAALLLCCPKLSGLINKLAHKKCNTHNFGEVAKKL